MSVFDLKSISHYGLTLSIILKGPDYVQRSIRLLAVNGFFPKKRIQQMRSSVQWQSSSQDFHLYGPVPVHGFCSTNRPRKFTRHRNLPSPRYFVTPVLRFRFQQCNEMRFPTQIRASHDYPNRKMTNAATHEVAGPVQIFRKSKQARNPASEIIQLELRAILFLALFLSCRLY